MTKKQKKEKAKRTSAKRRVAVALAKFLRQANPAKFKRSSGASVRRTKNGVSITFKKKVRAKK